MTRRAATPRSASQRVILVIATLLGFVMGSDAVADTKVTGRPSLRLLTTIQAPPFGGMAWFPDSRRLAISSDGIRVIDTTDGTTSKKLTSHVGSPIYLSPDGNYLLAVQAAELQVFSTHSWKELARQDVSNAGCRYGSSGGVAFVSDGKEIWIGCSDRQKPGALRLSIPDLKVIERFNIDPVLAGKLSVHVQPNPAVLHVITTQNPVDNLSADRKVPGRFARVIDLASRKDILTSLSFAANDQPYGVPPRVYLSADRQRYINYSGSFVPSGGISTFDLATKDRVLSFGPAFDADTPPMTAQNGGWSLSNLAFLKGGFVVAATHSARSGLGRVMIWDYHTGARSAEATGPMVLMPIQLSPDQSRLAAARDETVYIYSVSR